MHNSREMAYPIKVEYAEARRIRERNKKTYRLAHWPIWIWVFFLAPGPLTFDLFAHGGSGKNLAWLLFVMAATGVAGFYGQLPGVEPRPYILRFTEDRPNPLYRKICYTFAWNAVLNFALMNLAGLVIAVVTGRWVMKQIYLQAYFPVCAVVLLLGFFGWLPRGVRAVAGLGDGHRRRLPSHRLPTNLGPGRAYAAPLGLQMAVRRVELRPSCAPAPSDPRPRGGR